MQSHDGHPHWGMVWPPTSWTHVFPDLITRILADVNHRWWIQGKNSRKKRNDIILHVGDTILAAAEEASIDESWCLLNNQSTFNAFINGKYISKIIDAPDGKYLRVHCNAGVTYTNNIVDLHVYSNIVWYNPKEIAKTMSLRLVQKHHLGTYNIQYRN